MIDPVALDLEMTRGDTAAWDITILNPSDGTVADITGAALWFSGKFNPEDPDSKALFIKSNGARGGIVVVNPTVAPQAYVQLATGDTSGLAEAVELSADVQVMDASGKVYTAAAGRLQVYLDVTQTVTP